MRFITSEDSIPAATEPAPGAGAGGHRLFTPEQWQTAATARPLHEPAGLVLANDVDVRVLAIDLSRFVSIDLQFPKWTDGRAYSQARLLRTRLGYRGELRATGDVLVDMALPLARTGFDTALLRPGQSLQDAQRALRFFEGLLPEFDGAPAWRGLHPQPVYYQGDVLDPHPLFLKIPSGPPRRNEHRKQEPSRGRPGMTLDVAA